MDQDRNNCLHLALSRLGVGGEYFVAGFEGGDRDCLTGSQEYFCVSGERGTGGGLVDQLIGFAYCGP